MNFRFIAVLAVFIAFVLLSGCATKVDRELLSTQIPDGASERLQQGVGCSTAEDELLTVDGLSAFCARILYATNRKPDFSGKHATFVSDKGIGATFGYAEVAVPLIRIKDKSKADGLLYEDDLVRKGSLRSDQLEIKQRFGLTRLVADDLSSPKIVREAFIKDIEQFSSKSDDAVFLFIPGWGHSFDSALFLTAKISQDLAFNFADQKTVLSADRKKYPLGQPILFSWPTKQDASTLDDIGATAKSYTRDRKRAMQAGPVLADTLMAIAQADVKTINIVAYSMGNNTLLSGLEEFSVRYADVGRQNIAINIVHAASDSLVIDTERVYRKIERLGGKNAIRPKVTVYASDTDLVLGLSTVLSPTIGASDVDDSCRAGFAAGCDLFYIGNPRYTTVSASNFLSSGKGIDGNLHEYFANNPTILADAGCALAGISPPKSRNGNSRALKVYKVRDGIFGLGDVKSKHWRMVQNKGKGDCLFTWPYAYGFECDMTDPADADACGKLLSTVRDRAEAAGETFVHLLGDVLAATGNYVAATAEGSSLGGVLFDLTSSKIGESQLKQIEIIASKVRIRSKQKLVVIGYTDTSGSSEFNDQLALQRAEAVKNTLERKVHPEIQITSMVVGESSKWGGDLSDEKSPFGGYRQKKSRRVEIIICTENCKFAFK